MSRDPRLFLEDILQSCSKIGRYTRGMSLEDFVQDERTWDAVKRNLEIIGEATKNLDETTRKRLSEVEWRKVAGLRDILIHAYFGIDEDRSRRVSRVR